jgi:benzoate/toluate 1,2-dioxygenase reductase component
MKTPPSQKPPAGPYNAEVLDRRWLSDITFEIELTRPPSFQFNPGQRILIIHQQFERDYSIASDPNGSPISLCIRHVQGGRLTPLLAAVKTGSRISFTGPHGYFLFRPSRRPPVFIATGTGVAPFVSMARAGIKEFTLLHGVRRPSELYYEALFRSAAKRYVPCLSGRTPESYERKNAFQGRVTDYLQRNLPPGLYDFYLSGRMEMIRDVTHLVDESYPGSFIYTEIFY